MLSSLRRTCDVDMHAAQIRADLTEIFIASVMLMITAATKDLRYT